MKGTGLCLFEGEGGGGGEKEEKEAENHKIVRIIKISNENQTT
jgi:hypothetical protein